MSRPRARPRTRMEPGRGHHSPPLRLARLRLWARSSSAAASESAAGPGSHHPTHPRHGDDSDRDRAGAARRRGRSRHGITNDWVSSLPYSFAVRPLPGPKQADATRPGGCRTHFFDTERSSLSKMFASSGPHRDTVCGPVSEKNHGDA